MNDVTESKPSLTYMFVSVDQDALRLFDSTEHMAFTTGHISAHNSFGCSSFIL